MNSPAVPYEFQIRAALATVEEAPWWVQDRVAYHLAIELGERGH